MEGGTRSLKKVNARVQEEVPPVHGAPDRWLEEEDRLLAAGVKQTVTERCRKLVLHAIDALPWPPERVGPLHEAEAPVRLRPPDELAVRVRVEGVI